jgi:hypothetical protein
MPGRRSGDWRGMRLQGSQMRVNSRICGKESRNRYSEAAGSRRRVILGELKRATPNLERECLSTEDRSHHIQGARAVTKTLVARHELERIALQEIRSFPGCEYVTDIEIAYQVDRVLRTNWTIHVFTREGGDMLRIQYAINTTRKKLRHRYDLRPES